MNIFEKKKSKLIWKCDAYCEFDACFKFAREQFLRKWHRMAAIEMSVYQKTEGGVWPYHLLFPKNAMIMNTKYT